MPKSEKLSPHVLAALQARESFKNRDFPAALEQAREAARYALEAEDQTAWWNMSYLQAECLRDQGALWDCLEATRKLATHPLSSKSSFAARMYIMFAVAHQGLGHLAEAAANAARASEVVAANEEHIDLQIQAQRSLIAALAESRRVDEAWRESLVLETLLTDLVDEDTAGKAYWVIGNVAFLSERISEGGRYHDMAAEQLSHSKDVDLWARFNRASAVMRLEANLTDQATLRCIERAELATDIVGGSERDLLEMSFVRAHWYFLTGDMENALALLKDVCSRSEFLAAQTAGEARFLLGKALLAQGDKTGALEQLETAQVLFEGAAASERSAQVKGFAAAIE
jgi:tetratricopeptide (TPR) repeat protein